MNFHVVIVKPPGHIHSECFREVGETLVHGLRALGHSADLGVNDLHHGAKHIVLGGHLLPPSSIRFSSDWILYNLEQLGSDGAVLPAQYFDLAKQVTVWDYSERNTAEWKKRGIEAKVVPIGYVPQLTRIKQAAFPDIDVLFYGSMNERRQRVLSQLQDWGLKISAQFGEYGILRDTRIARAKLVLNLHYYEAKLFEIVRVSYLMANGIPVVTEDSSDIPIDLRQGLVVAARDDLAGACRKVLSSASCLEELGRHGLACFSQRAEPEYLREALDEVEVQRLHTWVDLSRPELRSVVAEGVQPCVISFWTLMIKDHPRKAEGIEIHVVGDECEVYETAADRIHRLNPTSALILEFCDGNHSAAEIAALVQEAYGLPDAPLDEVSSCLNSLKEIGIVR